MNDSTIWWLAAGGLISLELITGTFYLLMMSLGLVSAALSAHAGLEAQWQWVMGAAVGGGSVLLLRHFRKSQPPIAPAKANPDANLDIGETVHVEIWNGDGQCSVKYRGARWDAAILPGEAALPGPYCIAEVVGSRLILKKSQIS
jgi:membrane protein implicated in regulation of membrane protease activity